MFRLGPDFDFSDISDIRVVEEIPNEILQNEEAQVIIDDGHEIRQEGDNDTETIVIETINDVDMEDAAVFENVANEVSIVSTGPFERQNMTSELTQYFC